jgi:hypothetical protein
VRELVHGDRRLDRSADDQWQQERQPTPAAASAKDCEHRQQLRSGIHLAERTAHRRPP